MAEKIYRVWRTIAKDIKAKDVQDAHSKFKDHGTVLRDNIIVHGLVVNGLVKHTGANQKNGN